MRKTLTITLTLLTIFITACGQQTPSPSSTLVIPTQTQTAPPTVTLTSTFLPLTIETDIPTLIPDNSTPITGVSFKNDVSPIFENSCNKCHGIEQIKEGLDTRTYETLMAGSFNGPVITSGNAADSFLVEQLLKGEMPKRGNKLTDDQIQIIIDWINAGAINN